MGTLRLLALAQLSILAVVAQRVGVPTTDLDKVSVDELFSVQVTSVGRKAQKLAKAPAAVYVLTAADIRRSGATSIPEALQLVPGLTVLSLDGRSWIVSARGGARQYADKILVMIDGRSLYAPLFSGVVWDAIDTPLEDIEQIEVVRGPGAVMWGPNAVNGVINIITKNARETKRGQIASSGGTGLENATSARWGMGNDRIEGRVWGKFTEESPAYGSSGYYNLPGLGAYLAGPIGNLDSTAERLGFRVDGQPDDRDQWMVEGDVFTTKRNDVTVTPVLFPVIVDQAAGRSNYQGGDLLAKWIHTTAAGAENTLQLSYDALDADYSFVGHQGRNLTLNFESRQQTGERNEVYWGVGYQQYWDSSNPHDAFAYQPEKSVFRSGDVVGRDEWQFIPGKLMGSAGIRLDYSSYHHLEYQPSLRLLFTPDASQSLWFAASRAVRTPNRIDHDLVENAGSVLAGNLPMQLWVYGSKNMRSEVERSLETGYRYQHGQIWSVDGSVYWSYYERLRVIENPGLPALSFPGGVPTLTSSVGFCNCGGGRSYGAEVWGTWQVRPGWRLSPSYAYLNEARWLPSSAYVQYFWDGTPVDLAHQGLLRSQHDLTRNLQFDFTARARSRDEQLYHVPGVFLMDAHLAWRPWRTGEFSLTVKNLAGREVLEGFSELQTAAIPIRRTFTLKWPQRF